MIARFRIGYAPDSGFLLRDRLKGEFSEEVLRESGLFSWKEDSSQPSALSRLQNPRSLDTGGPLEGERPTSARDDTGGGEPTTHDQRPMAVAMYSKFRNRVMFPIASEA